MALGSLCHRSHPRDVGKLDNFAAASTNPQDSRDEKRVHNPKSGAYFHLCSQIQSWRTLRDI